MVLVPVLKYNWYNPVLPGIVIASKISWGNLTNCTCKHLKGTSLVQELRLSMTCYIPYFVSIFSLLFVLKRTRPLFRSFPLGYILLLLFFFQSSCPSKRSLLGSIGTYISLRYDVHSSSDARKWFHRWKSTRLNPVGNNWSMGNFIKVEGNILTSRGIHVLYMYLCMRIQIYIHAI